jgi:hypothetical protein
MKDCAIVLLFGALCAVGCTTSPSAQTSGVNTAGSMSGNPAGSSAVPPKMQDPTAGITASGAAGAPPSTSGAAGSASAAAGSDAASGAAGKAAAAGEVHGSTPASGGNAPPGSFEYVYNIALRDLCTTCHTSMGLFSSPDLSNPAKAYDSLVNKDASTMMPGQCTGKGKLITPGNCETSIIYSKISQTMPLCGRHMPLSSDTMPTFVPKEGIDALCAWIKAGAKKD